MNEKIKDKEKNIQALVERWQKSNPEFQPG